MFDSRGIRLSRRDRYETPLQRVQNEVQRSGLQIVFDSLPTPDSFTFHRTSKNGHDTIKLFLGHRINPNGSTSQAWARIVSPAERADLQPPVLFYDQESSADGTRTAQYPRSASSLLRKATELLPPFCFLQHDPIDEASNTRGMVSAIILYLAAATQVDTFAGHWDDYGESLIQSLRYIGSRDAFQQWCHQQKLAVLVRPSSIKTTGTAVEEDSLQETKFVSSSDPLTEQSRIFSSSSIEEHVIRSRGTSINIGPNTALAKLKNVLGTKNFKLLDHIPPKPIKISRHNVGGARFPFRILIGTAAYMSTEEVIDIYAYIDHQGAKSASMVFMSHDKANFEQRYDVNHLRNGVDLIQPLEYLNTLKKDSYKDDAKSARTAKLRSIISYYFFIAENEGLIENPGLDIHEGFGKRLCAVCRELGLKNWADSDGGGGDKDNIGHGVDENVDSDKISLASYEDASERNDSGFPPREGSDAESARVVRLKIRPEALSKVLRSESAERDESMSDQNASKLSPFNSQPAVEAMITTTAPLQLEMRPSSQAAHEYIQPPTDCYAGLYNINDVPQNVVVTEYQRQGSCNLQTGISPGAAREDQTLTPCSAVPGLTVDLSAKTAPSENVHAGTSTVTRSVQGETYVRGLVDPIIPATEMDPASNESQNIPHGSASTGFDFDDFVSTCLSFTHNGSNSQSEQDIHSKATADGGESHTRNSLNWALFGRRACFPGNKRPPTASFLLDSIAMQKKPTDTAEQYGQIQASQQNDHQSESSGSHGPMSIFPPTLTPVRTCASRFAPGKIVPTPSVMHALATVRTSSLVDAQVGGNRPNTPDGSTESNWKIQAKSSAPFGIAKSLSSAREPILISDDEDENTTPSARRSAVRRVVCDGLVDLTQLSSPRGKRRKVLGPSYVSDSDSSTIAETDGSEWRRKSRVRRK